MEFKVIESLRNIVFSIALNWSVNVRLLNHIALNFELKVFSVKINCLELNCEIITIINIEGTGAIGTFLA